MSNELLELVAAAKMALPLLEEDRASFFDCHTVGGDPSTMSEEEAVIVDNYDSAIFAIRRALSQEIPNEQ